MVTKQLYLLEYKRNEYRFNSNDWVILGKAWTNYSIHKQLDEFYNLFIKQVKSEDNFITSSIYENKAIINFRGGVIELKITQAEFEDYE